MPGTGHTCFALKGFAGCPMMQSVLFLSRLENQWGLVQTGCAVDRMPGVRAAVCPSRACAFSSLEGMIHPHNHSITEPALSSSLAPMEKNICYVQSDS